jgi:hypothetical protein
MIVCYTYKQLQLQIRGNLGEIKLYGIQLFFLSYMEGCARE